MNMYNYVYNNLIRLSKIYLYGLIIFFMGRLFMISSFSSLDEVYISGDLISAFVMGFRVDTQVLMYGLALPVLVILMSPLLLYVKVSSTKIDTLIRATYLFAISVLGLILIGNYFFYEQFNENYNLLIFAFFNDDTTAILNTIWTTYPIVKMILALIGVNYILNMGIKIVFEKEIVFKLGIVYKILFIVLFFSSYFVLMRGSIGMFPLGDRDLIVSENTFVNDIATNGVLSLKQAISNRASNKFNIDIIKTLQKEGFNSEKEAISDYLVTEVDSVSIGSLMSLTKKDDSLDKNKYNVVFIVMESMNNNYIDLHSEKMNLLGSLEKELDSLIVFRNFIPKGPRTIHSLDGLIVNNIQRAPLSQTIYSNITFSMSNIKPFKDNGYHTVFAYGGQLGWRNIKDFYKHQYFDEIQGDITLLRRQKGATGGLWGIYDEFLFNDIYESLSLKESITPLMCFAMTTSNHTPYLLPDTYNPYPLELSDSIKGAMIKGEELVKNHFLTYQYSNDQLGKFISKIRNSSLADNTIIVVTGDHTNTEIFNYDDSNLFNEISVPLLMYLPDELKKKLVINPSIYGSHKDIFPTIFNLALSNTEYVNSGNDLFNTDIVDFYGVSNNGYVICKDGAIRLGSQSKYYKWGKNKTMKIIDDATVIYKLKKVEKQAKGYKASMIFLLQKEIEQYLN